MEFKVTAQSLELKNAIDSFVSEFESFLPVLQSIMQGDILKYFRIEGGRIASSFFFESNALYEVVPSAQAVDAFRYVMREIFPQLDDMNDEAITESLIKQDVANFKVNPSELFKALVLLDKTTVEIERTDLLPYFSLVYMRSTLEIAGAALRANGSRAFAQLHMRRYYESLALEAAKSLPFTPEELGVDVENNIQLKIQRDIASITSKFEGERKGKVSSTANNQKGYVYVLSNASMPGLVKIGSTARNPEERARELSRVTGVPTPFELVYYREFLNYEEAERSLHANLHIYRTNDKREFFTLNKKEAIDHLLALPDGI